MGDAEKTSKDPKPKSETRPTVWSAAVEEAYRFQLAGYQDEAEYLSVGNPKVDRWPHNGFIKKLQRPDGCFFYFDKERECSDKQVRNCIIYV